MISVYQGFLKSFLVPYNLFVLVRVFGLSLKVSGWCLGAVLFPIVFLILKFTTFGLGVWDFSVRGPMGCCMGFRLGAKAFWKGSLTLNPNLERLFWGFRSLAFGDPRP